jgi:formate hydrogenlyase subunit 6/NADH:ubiquinone oxidoreductase subunit I
LATLSNSADGRYFKYEDGHMNPITPIINGMAITFKHMFMKPVTLQYPTERPKVAERYRGLHGLKVSHSKAKCVACYLCPTVCPGGGYRRGRRGCQS